VLYEEAIGTYDFKLARSVATGSQMDPKVYLMELGDLEALEDARGKYEVDVRLKRWEKAVRHLKEAGGEVEEIVKMCETHRMYEVGLELYKEMPERGKIMEIVAEKYVRDGFPKAAICLLLGLKKYGRAIEIAKIEGDWEGVMTYFELCDEEEREEKEDIVEELVEQMELTASRKSLLQASTLLLQYLPTPENQVRAVKLLTSANYFISATRECKRLGLSESNINGILDAAKNSARTVSTDIEERRVRFKVNLEKYKKSKELYDEKEKRKEEEGFGENERFGGGSEFSATTSFSNASSNMSMSSTNSARSYTSGYSKASSAFTFSKGTNAHGLKYKSNKEANKIKNRERRNAKRMAKKMQPGSIEEVKYYKGVLLECKVGEEERRKITECANYLVRYGEVEGLARRLVSEYDGIRKDVMDAEVDDLEMEQLDGSLRAIMETFAI